MAERFLSYYWFSSLRDGFQGGDVFEESIDIRYSFGARAADILSAGPGFCGQDVRSTSK